MTKTKKLLPAVLLLAVCCFAAVFWAYRHPEVHYSPSGPLRPLEVVTTAAYGPLHVPGDIRSGLTAWQGKLERQYAKYDELYDSFEVTYSTEIGADLTTLTFRGYGVAADGTETAIDDTETLPYAIYPSR